MKNNVCFYLVTLLLVSCQKENNQLSAKTNETIYVENASASMRVNIRGNTASKVMMLVVHGGPGGASYFYRTDAAINQLEPKYAVAYWDQRVAGASQGGNNRGTVVMKQYGEDLKAVILVLKKKYGQDLKVFLMGQSWGGMVCASFMTQGNNQELVQGWIAANAVHNWRRTDSLSRLKLLNFGLEQIILNKNVAKLQEIVEFCIKNSGPLDKKNSEKLNGYAYDGLKLIEGFTPLDEDEVIKKNLVKEKIPYTNSFLNLVNGSTDKLLDEIRTIEFSSQLFKVIKPVLALSGNYDFVVPEGNAIEMISKISSPKKERKLFMKTGHNLEEQEAYVAAFIKFIDENK
jgi:pimeloyl-ACP methyl ester carboxylesterase